MSADLIFLHGNASPHCSSRVDKWFEGYYTLQFMEGGELELSYDDSAYRLNGNWFWTCEPGPHIRFNVARQAHSWSHRYVAFRGTLLNQWRLSGLWFVEPQSVEGGEHFAALFDELLDLTQRGTDWGRRLGVNMLERILLELAEERACSARSNRSQKAWLDTVLERLAGPEPVADYTQLAGECGMSLSHFRLQFRQAAGVPLHTYVMQQRIAAARTLLIETELPTKAIAYELGYSDVHFFTRQFRRFTGSTPGAYRKSRIG